MQRLYLFPALICSVLSGLFASPAYAWVNDTPAGASQCGAADVNNNGTLIMNCKVSNASVTDVVLSGGGTVQLAPLSSTAGGVPCASGAINNAPAGQETIIGSCNDGNNVSQAVVWNTAQPGSPLQLMPWNGLLGIIGNGVTTGATGVNLQGIVIGVSTDANGTDMPVYWAGGSNVATALNAPLLAQQANCAPSDINDAKTPSIVGNCPGAGGKNVAVLWPTLSAPYSVLPVPGGASYCMAAQINLNGQILGECIYGTDTHRATIWGSGGTGPTVLQTINGNQALRTVGVSQSDAGLVAVNFLAGGAQAGFYEPAVWNPASGTNAPSIALPSGSIRGTVGGIGNNGKAVGNFETAAGDVHSFHIEPNSLTAVDDGAPAGGPNAAVTALSTSGVWMADTAENSNKDAQAEVQQTP
ncbi:HAF family protein [Burkholderia cenocepacia]|uniref:HAF family protein n=1 Tax=Burkholderia cenocepacia TaxID=95486 RepID=UPI000F5AF347|nr:HAF family protein [Burkholderia cenocepacia]